MTFTKIQYNSIVRWKIYCANNIIKHLKNPAQRSLWATELSCSDLIKTGFHLLHLWLHVCSSPQSSLWIVWKKWISPEPNSRGTSPWGAPVLLTWRRPSRCPILSSNHLWTRRATGTWTSSQSPPWGTTLPTGRDATLMTASRTPSPVWSSSTAWPRCYQRTTILTRGVCGEHENTTNEMFCDFVVKSFFFSVHFLINSTEADTK